MSVFVKEALALEVEHLIFQMYEKKCNWINFPWKGEAEKTVSYYETNYHLYHRANHAP